MGDCSKCDMTWCEQPAVTVSSTGPAESRRLRCDSHRVLGGELGNEQSLRGKPENDWCRGSDVSFDDVVAKLRAERPKKIRKAGRRS
jgi:hypothetical protein